MISETMDQLAQAGLLESVPQPHLTLKGRDWLRALGDLETAEVVDRGEAAEDFILSTSGLFR